MDFDLETTWKDLEDVMLNEVSQTHEGKHCMISLDVKSKTAKPREAESEFPPTQPGAMPTVP